MLSILRILISFLLVVCIFNLGYSQKRKKKKRSSTTSTRAIVQYNDGSVFIGDIVFEGALSMKMVLTTNDTVNLNKAYMGRIKRGDKNISLFDGAKFHYTKGFFYSFRFGGMNSDGFENETSEFSFIGGYRFNKMLAAGLGIGGSYNSTRSFGTLIDASTIPVFAYARFYPLDKKIKPFIGSSLGWGFQNAEASGAVHTGGLYFQPEIGVNFSSRRRLRFTLSIGQQIQHVKGSSQNTDPLNNPVISNFNIWFNRTILKFGLEWK